MHAHETLIKFGKLTLNKLFLVDEVENSLIMMIEWDEQSKLALLNFGKFFILVIFVPGFTFAESTALSQEMQRQGRRGSRGTFFIASFSCFLILKFLYVRKNYLIVISLRMWNTWDAKTCRRRYCKSLSFLPSIGRASRGKRSLPKLAVGYQGG